MELKDTIKKLSRKELEEALLHYYHKSKYYWTGNKDLLIEVERLNQVVAEYRWLFMGGGE